MAGTWEGKAWYYPVGDRATYPEAEPNDTCPGQQMACGDVVSPGYLDPGTLDWYTWTCNVGDALTVYTGPVNTGDSTDTYIELYGADCATMLAYNDDFGSLYSRIENYMITVGGTYNLKVRGYSTVSSGPYAFHLECGTPPPPPTGDTCATATVIEDCTSGSLSGDVSTFNNDYDPGSGGCATGYAEAGRDAAIVMNLAAGGNTPFTYTQTGGADASFYIVTDCANVAGTCLIGADAAGSVETITWTVPYAGTFYMILDAYGSLTGGPWTLDYSIQCATPQACCFTDGSCQFLLPGDCQQQGGSPYGAGTDCDPNPCPQVPSHNSTWGQIKGSYR